MCIGRSIPRTTRRRWRWQGGRVAGVLGYVDYNDNDTAADNRRNATYAWMEGEQAIVGGLCAASLRHCPVGGSGAA